MYWTGLEFPQLGPEEYHWPLLLELELTSLYLRSPSDIIEVVDDQTDEGSCTSSGSGWGTHDQYGEDDDLQDRSGVGI